MGAVMKTLTKNVGQNAVRWKRELLNSADLTTARRVESACQSFFCHGTLSQLLPTNVSFRRRDSEILLWFNFYLINTFFFVLKKMYLGALKNDT